MSLNTTSLINIFILSLSLHTQYDDFEIKLHDYFVSNTEVDYINEKKLLQITIRVFTDDIEEMIRDRNSKLKIDPDSNSEKINQILNQYFKENLKIFINNKLIIFDFIGKEYKNDLTQIYYESSIVETINDITFENRILCDYFDSQQNIVHFKSDKYRKSFVLNKNNSKAIFELE